MGDSAEKKEKKARPSVFKGMRAEFQKIVWPDRQETFRQSVAVVVIAVVVGVIIAMLDFVVKNGVNILTSFSF